MKKGTKKEKKKEAKKRADTNHFKDTENYRNNYCKHNRISCCFMHYNPYMGRRSAQ